MKHTHTRRCELPWHWPDPPLRVVLVAPEIPPNTGNIARLCAGTGTSLHLVEPLGFRVDEPAVRRAGLDYWDAVKVCVHPDLDHFFRQEKPERFFLFSTAGATPHAAVRYQPGDALIFGCETRGLPEELLRRHADRVVGIPLLADKVRSLNLSNAVAVAVYEALRQMQTPA